MWYRFSVFVFILLFQNMFVGLEQEHIALTTCKNRADESQGEKHRADESQSEEHRADATTLTCGSKTIHLFELFRKCICKVKLHIQQTHHSLSRMAWKNRAGNSEQKNIALTTCKTLPAFDLMM
jgi:hypothetical protein